MLSSVSPSVDSSLVGNLCTVCGDTCFAASAIHITASRTDMDLASWVAGNAGFQVG
jgi:hypothetical protein